MGEVIYLNQHGAQKSRDLAKAQLSYIQIWVAQYQGFAECMWEMAPESALMRMRDHLDAAREHIMRCKAGVPLSEYDFQIFSTECDTVSRDLWACMAEVGGVMWPFKPHEDSTSFP